MSQFTCNEDGELNTLEFKPGMVIMYDPNYQQWLINNGFTKDAFSIYPSGWDVLTNVRGSVRGVNPRVNLNTRLDTCELNTQEFAQDTSTYTKHTHGLPVGGSNSTVIVGNFTHTKFIDAQKSSYQATTSVGSTGGSYPPFFNVPPQTSLMFLTKF